MVTCEKCDQIIPDGISQCEVCGNEFFITFSNEPKLSIEEVREIFREMTKDLFGDKSDTSKFIKWTQKI